MGKMGELIDDIQKRLDEIEAEATRLMVFANDSSDAALGARLQEIGRVIFDHAGNIENNLNALKSESEGQSRNSDVTRTGP